MKDEDLGVAFMTFIVRVWPERPERLTGVVERVRTGEKHRFDGAEDMRQIIERIVRAERGPGA